MTAILGISAFYHDSAAALVIDGRIAAAAQEERFTRQKHDASLPTRAIDYCLEEARLAPEQLDYVGFYDKPLLKFERLLETYLQFAPRGSRSIAARPCPAGFTRNSTCRGRFARAARKYAKRCVFVNTHQSHAAALFPLAV